MDASERTNETVIRTQSRTLEKEKNVAPKVQTSEIQEIKNVNRQVYLCTVYPLHWRRPHRCIHADVCHINEGWHARRRQHKNASLQKQVLGF